MNWWTLPENVSVHGADMDAIFWIITWITVAIFLIVNIALVYFIIRYRHRDGHKAHYTHGNVRTEIIWTVIPFLIVVFIAFRSSETWLDARSLDRMPQDALELTVTASQFEWQVGYPGPDGEIETDDDFEVRNQLHFPVDRPVIVYLTSEDVIHSFFLPKFRVKQDALPGSRTPIWFEATRTGEFTLACAELCGLGHYRMHAAVTVHDADEFQRWHDAGGELPASASADGDGRNGEDGVDPGDDETRDNEQTMASTTGATK